MEADQYSITRKVEVGKKMCDIAEEVMRTSEIEKYCASITAAIKSWRRHEANVEEAAYKEVVEAGNELYMLLDYGVANYEMQIGLKEKAIHVMSMWFDSLTNEESQELSAYVASIPYKFD
jgi:hypothetical protein